MSASRTPSRPMPVPEPKPERLTCARTGTARGNGACLAGTAGTCACLGWTA